jgi:hypothetical protein
MRRDEDSRAQLVGVVKRQRKGSSAVSGGESAAVESNGDAAKVAD